MSGAQLTIAKSHYAVAPTRSQTCHVLVASPTTNQLCHHVILSIGLPYLLRVGMEDGVGGFGDPRLGLVCERVDGAAEGGHDASEPSNDYDDVASDSKTIPTRCYPQRSCNKSHCHSHAHWPYCNSFVHKYKLSLNTNSLFKTSYKNDIDDIL